jgi:hypothetical protein
MPPLVKSPSILCIAITGVFPCPARNRALLGLSIESCSLSAARERRRNRKNEERKETEAETRTEIEEIRE